MKLADRAIATGCSQDDAFTAEAENNFTLHESRISSVEINPANSSDPSLSIVVPFYNESSNVRLVLEELRSEFPHAEIIAVDDGSADDTWEQILAVKGVRALRLDKNLGQSAAVFQGLRASRGQLCGLMDGDGQNDPASFHFLLEEFARGNCDVVCGYRKTRHDTLSRKIASRAANAIRRFFLGDGVRDTGCSQKVFRREAVDLLVPFCGLHRYLPALFKQAGLSISEVPVNHRARQSGVSKYSNWSRAVVGVYDLIGVSWLLKRKLPIVRMQERR